MRDPRDKFAISLDALEAMPHLVDGLPGFVFIPRDWYDRRNHYLVLDRVQCDPELWLWWGRNEDHPPDVPYGVPLEQADLLIYAARK